MTRIPFRDLFALTMSGVYVCAGLVLLFTSVLDTVIVQYRQTVGGVLVAYGALRLLMHWRKRGRAERTEHP